MKEKEKAIGLLDSGLGGLSIFRELKKQLPQEQVIYFGDTAHAPYGEKSDDEIIAYVISIVNFLLEQEVKLIVIGCNTATAVSLGKIKESYNITIIGIIRYGAQEAVNKTRNKKIGIIGTEVTIRNNSYEKIIKDIDPSITTYSNACSNQIIREMEEQSLSKENKIKLLLRDCIRPLARNGIDTLIWGCSHYPFLREYIEGEISQNIMLVDPAQAMVKEVKKWLVHNDLNNNTTINREDIFYISGNPDLFARITKKLLGYSPGKFIKPFN
jgi:glutamate racemase